MPHQAPPVSSRAGSRSASMYILRVGLATPFTLRTRARPSRFFRILLTAGCCRFVLLRRSFVQMPACHQGVVDSCVFFRQKAGGHCRLVGQTAPALPEAWMCWNTSKSSVESPFNLQDPMTTWAHGNSGRHARWQTAQAAVASLDSILLEHFLVDDLVRSILEDLEPVLAQQVVDGVADLLQGDVRRFCFNDALGKALHMVAALSLV